MDLEETSKSHLIAIGIEGIYLLTNPIFRAEQTLRYLILLDFDDTARCKRRGKSRLSDDARFLSWVIISAAVAAQELEVIFSMVERLASKFIPLVSDERTSLRRSSKYTESNSWCSCKCAMKAPMTSLTNQVAFARALPLQNVNAWSFSSQSTSFA